MTITRDLLADQLKSYLNEQTSLASLVDWAEGAMFESDFEEGDFELIRDIVAKLGVSDVAAFGLTWEDAKSRLESLGYRPKLAFETM
ncbi:MAG: hypothetical protein QGG64_22310 [Candidatus Latescibacteria bacterium]|jgi:hypothetical protein|nr:hypothetical protein [Candidatus Latescibacterota bacterium]